MVQGEWGKDSTVVSLFFSFFFFLWPCHVEGGILAPRPGIEPVPPAVEAWSPNHWTAREVPVVSQLQR